MKYSNIINTINNKKYGNIIRILSITFFVIISLYQVVTHVPFFDEINAWNIAAYLKPSEIFEITKYEGHLFIWYFLLKPFAQYDIGFPISMKIINWIFVFGAVLILWFKAPFHYLIKAFITFSLPIKVFYIHARCYGIGIFLLFSLCSLYKDRLKHPYLYACLLLLIGNTSVMALVVAFCLGLCFLYDLNDGVKNNIITKKDVVLIISICTTGAIGILFQLCNFVMPAYSDSTFDYAKHLHIFFVSLCHPLQVLLLFCYLWLLAFAWKFFEKNKRPLLFLALSTYMHMLIFCGIYRSAYWHFMFLFVNIITALWLYLSEHKISNSFQKRYLAIFCLMFISMLSYPGRYDAAGFHSGITYYLQTHIQEYKNNKIFLFPTDSSSIGIVPEMRKYGYKFYDCYGNPYGSKNLYINQWRGPDVDFDAITKLLKKGEKAYVFVSISSPHFDKKDLFNSKILIYKYKHKKPDLKITPMRHIYNVYIWEIIKK